MTEVHVIAGEETASSAYRSRLQGVTRTACIFWLLTCWFNWV